ncbi:ABC transporter permease [Ferrimonas balearica]|uniref:ABC transporter permease n=1 Tax=Ferrimonas balearica TaxID=44012 RepID=UPI001C9A2318|nr:FtsX-like permease family protein [Ferrimonas balearica]MBY5920215.1 ABC transporter permease [Ferrimonas balearica]MBY5997100.1 ABC transporter permease [Ferrimonas balearica]
MFELRPIFSALLRSKSGPLLIILQLALTLAVVANAAHIIQERLTLMARDSGVVESELIAFTVAEMHMDKDFISQRRMDEQALRAIPGVIDAAASNQVPLTGSGSSTTVSSKPEGEEGGVDLNLGYYQGNEHLFPTLGLTLVEGRAFTANDILTDATPATLPSQVMLSRYAAERYFPEESAVGKQIYLHDHAVEVVGVYDTLQTPWAHRDHTYASAIVPMENGNFFARYMVRVEASQRDAVLTQIEDAMLKVAPDRVILSLRSFDDIRSRAYRNDNAMAKLLGTVIVLLLVVTALGIVGLASYSVGQRRKQIGTRRALGATRAAIVRHFLTENLMICVAGVVLGTLAAFALNQYLMHHYELTRLPLAYLGSTLVGLVLLSQLAAATPAIKAAQVSPALATRSV